MVRSDEANPLRRAEPVKYATSGEEAPSRRESDAEYRLTRHARLRLAERRILEEAIAFVIEHYDRRLDRTDGCTEYVGWFDDRRLKVVVDETTAPWNIVTIHDV